jgi:hypothetical protein
MMSEEVEKSEDRLRVLEMTDRVPVPAWLVALVVFVISPGLGFAVFENHLSAKEAREELSDLRQRYDEHLRQDRIASWRERCTKIAYGPDSAAGIGDSFTSRQAFIEMCMDNAAKEAWK